MSSKRQLSCSSPANAIGHNEDLMTQISVDLPVKSVLRFRSVSKKWYSLLTHPRFIKRYSSHKRRNSMLLFQRCLDIRVIDPLHLNANDHNLDIADFGHFRNPNDYGDLQLIQSCNGLLLFDSRDQRGQVTPRVNRFYVSNPFTKKSCELVVPDYLTYVQGFLCAYLSFDPCTSPYYKVAFLWNEDVFSRDYHISIFSSETKTCKNFDYTFDDQDPLSAYRGVYFKGAIFWSDFLLKTSSYFDINQESIKSVPLNRPYSGPDKDLKYFGGYGGHLHLIMGSETDHVLDVYELKEDYSSWVAKYKVDIESIAVDFPEIIISRENLGSVVPLLELVASWYNLVCDVSIRSGGKRYKYSLLSVLETEEEPTIILFAGNKLLAYNLIDKTTKKIYDAPSLGNGCDPFVSYNTFHCIESLCDVLFENRLFCQF